MSFQAHMSFILLWNTTLATLLYIIEGNENWGCHNPDGSKKSLVKLIISTRGSFSKIWNDDVGVNDRIDFRGN